MTKIEATPDYDDSTAVPVGDLLRLHKVSRPGEHAMAQIAIVAAEQDSDA